MKEGQGFAKKVTSETLESFREYLTDVLTDDITQKTARKRKTKEDVVKGEKELFIGIRISVRKTFHQTAVRPKSGTKIKIRKSSSDLKIKKGVLIWRKLNLPASDVQRQPGHATGGLRLTQARFKTGGQLIDQTTYFRKIVFGKLKWRVKSKSPIVETTKFKATVRIGNNVYGTRRFDVSHKPSGEAGQGNYTTILHWGSLGNTVKNLDLRGQEFKLFAPIEGKNSLYSIEID